MNKTVLIRTRIEPDLKRKAERVVAAMGMDLSESIRLYLRELTINQEMPFLVRTPNAASRHAMKEAKSGKLRTYTNKDEFFRDLKLR